jgi:hypothetical protein
MYTFVFKREFRDKKQTGKKKKRKKQRERVRKREKERGKKERERGGGEREISQNFEIKLSRSNISSRNSRC